MEVDAEVLLDGAESRIVEVEEPVAVAQRLELLLPYRHLQRTQLGAGHVLLGLHSDEGVHLVHRPVDRLEPRGHRRPAHRGDHVLEGLPGARLDLLAVAVEVTE